jgi:hypothetical protein
MNFTKLTNNLGMAFLLMAAFQSCENSAIEPDLADDYFPLRDGLEWRYERWVSISSNVTDNWLVVTLRLRIAGPVEIEGESYKKIVNANGEIDKIVRTEGSQYFGRNHEVYRGFTHEYIFLDTDKEVGESWSYIKDDGVSKTEYVIVAKHSQRAINGNVYKNVIEVEVNYYSLQQSGTFLHFATAAHYYAQGVGEIYHYYPYPVSLAYGDLRAFLINNK